MEQLKRPRNNDTERKKINLTTDECIITFEDLPNELICEVFEYLNLHHAFQGFYDLKKRFQNLFLHSNLSMKINISSISKSTFHRYLTQILIPHAYRIQSLRFSHTLAGDMIVFLFPIMTNLTRLETLMIYNIKSKYIEGLVDNLSSLPVLSSLIMTTNDWWINNHSIYQKIFCLPTLKYCQMFFGTGRDPTPLPMATNEFSSIEQLIMTDKIFLHHIDSLLSYFPQLHRLSFGDLDGYGDSRIRRRSIPLNHLTDVSLKLNLVSFDVFEILVLDFFRQVQVLHITVHSAPFRTTDTEYLNADRWEELISTYMSKLCVFDIHCQHHISFHNNNQVEYEAQVDKFKSLFWTKQQWFFAHHFIHYAWAGIAIFHSTNPYRRKDCIFWEEANRNVCLSSIQTHFNVRNLSVNKMKQFMSYFPNATELTLTKMFDVLQDSIATSLNRIIPLKQLTKLVLDCDGFSFERVIELLTFTPNVHTLQLDSILLHRKNSISMQQNETFRRVSKMNTITNVTIKRECTLEQIQLLTALVPRLECLTMHLPKDLQSKVRFLLSKTNNNTRYLSLLCVLMSWNDSTGNLKTLIKSAKLLHDYTLQDSNGTLILWW